MIVVFLASMAIINGAKTSSEIIRTVKAAFPQVIRVSTRCIRMTIYLIVRRTSDPMDGIPNNSCICTKVCATTGVISLTTIVFSIFKLTFIIHSFGSPSSISFSLSWVYVIQLFIFCMIISCLPQTYFNTKLKKARLAAEAKKKEQEDKEKTQ